LPDEAAGPAPVRAFWSGTISFGLVSIPVDFYAAARARQKAMRMVDLKGHPLGRQYTRGEDGKPLTGEEIVRGYETQQGNMVVVSDREFESAAPETSRDIELSRFVPLEQIAPWYFVRPYFLAPAQRSGKAYSLLAETMERTGKVGIGRFVMRGHEYLVAIIAESGILRAETLRYFDELRTPEGVGLPAAGKAAGKLVKQYEHDIDALLEKRLGLDELEDRDAEALQELAQRKSKRGKDVFTMAVQKEEDGGAEIVDLVQLLRRSLSGRASPAGRAADAHRDTHARTARALADRSRDDLYRMAASLNIRGRSKMSKSQLVHAVELAKERAAA